MSLEDGRPISRVHHHDCPECGGNGTVIYEGNANDPNARVYDCDPCDGRGQVECEGCAVCDPLEEA